MMHDLGVRIASTLLVSGVLLFVAWFLFSVLYPRKAEAAPPPNPTQSASRPKDYGYLTPAAQPLEWTLRALEARAKRVEAGSSWGWAIILTTFLVNLILLPFRILAARNARTLRALQPQIDAINARHKQKGPQADPSE